jgi:CBS domain-containing protein
VTSVTSFGECHHCLQHDVDLVSVANELEDLMRVSGAMTKDPVTPHIGALMSQNPVTCSPNDSLQDCEDLMRELGVEILASIPATDAPLRAIRQ